MLSLTSAIESAGMTPPRRIVAGRFVRFPGIGKGKSNRAGWCKLITPTLAVYGDWSSGFSATWKDDAHRDDEESARAMEDARRQAAIYERQQRERQYAAARKAADMILQAQHGTHPYLARKGFPEQVGLILDSKLLIPVRDVECYQRVISIQTIDEDGEKRFLPGGRTRNGIYRLGAIPRSARRIVLCEGYATALSLFAALQRLPGPHSVIVCFSANNLQRVAKPFPQALIAADHDESRTGERAAIATGLPWAMPPEIGDFNDHHQRHGLMAVTELLREAFQT